MAILVITIAETLFIGGIFLIYPRIARRGLLFGVYVGEEQSQGPEAQKLIRSWKTGILVWTGVSIAVTCALFWWLHNPVVTPLAPLLAALGYVVLFLRAYFHARTFGVSGPPPAVAVLEDREPSSPFPILVLIFCLIGGVVAISYGAMNYADLPDRVPTHFGASGKPDAWKAKSFWTVMLLPMMTFVMGVGMGGITILIASAKRAIRFPQTRVSAEAQQRFRQAVTRFIGGMAVLLTCMLAAMSIGVIQTGLGRAGGLSWIVMVLSVGMAVFALGGVLYIALRYGQGGARLEREAGNAPLTNGLADNRHWVLGTFYVNRDDPSIFVERRFGFGYTINFGNWKAVAFFVVFVGGILALALLARFKA